MELTLGDISRLLTLDVIDKCFKVKTNSADNVQSVKVTTAVPAGEGLISAVYRIHVKGLTYNITFIAKGLVRDQLLRRSLRCNRFFEREVIFFSVILPQFKELQKSLKSSEDIQRHVPICYSYHSGNDEDYLLLEDLSETSCKSVGNPTKEDSNWILRLLAHMHAVSIALRIYKSDVFDVLTEKISEEVYYNNDNCKWFAKYLQNAIEIDKKALLEYEPDTSKYYRKFAELVNSNPYGQLIELASYSGDHSTINHGDSWFPNFMVSNERVVAIDFQLVRCVSPVADLTYYLSLCSNLYTVKDNVHEALNLYYNSLEYFLADMGLNVKNIFSRKDLDKELKKYGRFGLLSALTTIPLMASSEKCDVGMSFQERFGDVDRIPLEELWPLVPMTNLEHKMRLVSAVRIAVDLGLI